MNEKKIDELFQKTSLNETNDIDRRIQKGIRNNIYRRAVITVLAALVLISVGIYGNDRIRESNSFHLADWRCVVSDELVEKTKDSYDIKDTDAVKQILNAQAYISAYCSIFLPGIIPEFCEPSVTYAKSEPYGTYQIGGRLVDYISANPENEPYFMKAEDNESFIRIENGRIVTDLSKSILNDGSRVLKNRNAYELFTGLDEGDFYSHFRDEATDNKTQAYVKEIQMLPDSAMICLDIRLLEPTSVFNLIRAATSYEDSRIVYAVTEYLPKSDGYEECAIGFSLIGGNGPSEFADGYESLAMDDTLRRDKSYFQQGMFYYNNQATFFGEPRDVALRFEERYRSLLNVLIESGALNDRELRAAKIALEHARSSEIEVIGYRIQASKKDALAILEKNNTLRSHITDVKLSRLN